MFYYTQIRSVLLTTFKLLSIALYLVITLRKSAVLSPDIGQNSDGGISDFWISGQSLIKKIVITQEPVMILNLEQQLNFTRETKRHVGEFVFRFMVNLEKSGSRIPDA